MAKLKIITMGKIKKALEDTGSFLGETAKKLNVSRTTLYTRIKESKQLQQLVEDIQESHLDLAESKLINKIKMGDLGGICFYLKCKGKKRGYVERQEQRITGDITLKID